MIAILEQKIKEYLKHDTANAFPEVIAKQAHDIVEIAENHIATKLIYVYKLEKENADLKLQLADTLGRFEGEMELNTKVMKDNTMLLKENKEALEAVEKLMNDNTELEATLDDNNLQIKNTNELEATVNDRIEQIRLLVKNKRELEAKLILRNGRILELEEQIKADNCDLCNDLQDENMKLKQQLKSNSDMAISACLNCKSNYKNLTLEINRLKQQLRAVKTLNRDEVEKMFDGNVTIPVYGYSEVDGVEHKAQIGKQLDVDNFITAICKLGYSKDKIVKVLKKHLKAIVIPTSYDLVETIADEIIKD